MSRMNKEESILFTIIIPTYNRAHIISNSIKSIINQTYQNWELVIIDDGSSDNTEEIISSFNDDRIKYFYKKNEERSIARNVGIDKSKGEYISFLDDDDYYLPEFLSTFHDRLMLNKRPVSIIMCDEFVENENGKRSKNQITEKFLNNPVRLLWEIQTSIRPFVIHRDILSLEKFKIECTFGQDFHLAIRIVSQYSFIYIPIGLSVNVKHKNQGTNTKFIVNYKENAYLSIMCIDDLLIKHKQLILKKIPLSSINNLYNHKFYGFGSAALKRCDIAFCLEMIKSFKYNGIFLKTVYYTSSLIVRIPFYSIKCLIGKLR